MRKRIFALFCSAMLLFAAALPCRAEALPGGITSWAYLVMDAKSGAPLYGYNEDVSYDPASVTKIMTMGLACEKAKGDWSTQLTVSHDDVHSLWRTDSTHIALRVGEVVTVEQMLYAAMLESANDACNVLASWFGGDGTIAAGVAAMNQKAAQLGLQNTRFANPHGISDAEHYISPYDLAVILRWALQQPGFYALFTNTETYYMPPTNLQPEQRGFWMSDYIRLPGKKNSYIPEVKGGKTGYTDEARYTYACLAEKDGVELICITMHSQQRTDKFRDVEALLDFGFAHYRYVTVPAAPAAQVAVQGGGGVLGNAQGMAPAMTVLLHEDLDASALHAAAEPAVYTVGGALPTVTWHLDGGDAQMDASFAAPMRLDGLDKLFAQAEGQPLAHAANPAADKKTPGAVVALAAAAGFAGAVWLVLRRVQPGRKAVAPRTKMQYDRYSQGR